MSVGADIIKKYAKAWACPDLMTSVFKASGKKIPFSSPSLNHSTYGGVPRAAISEFYGYPGGGKSTTAIDLFKNAKALFQKEYDDEVADLQAKIAEGKKECKSTLADLLDRGPKKCVYVDLEHTFSRKWARVLGFNVTEEDVMQPPNIPAEEILQMIQELIECGEYGFIVLDSIPSLVPQKELEKKYGEATVALLAGLMTQFCRKVTQLLIRYDCTMLFINQLRANLINPFADNTPGGEAIKFYASLRACFKLGKPLDALGNELPVKAENPAGYLIDVQLKKQKSAPFDRKLGQYYLMARSGLRIDFEYANLAIKQYNIIRKGGAWFTICDPTTKEPLEVNDMPVKLNGLAKVYDYLQINTEYYKSLCDFIDTDISKDDDVEFEVSSDESDNNYSMVD